MGKKSGSYPLRVAVRMTGLSAERLRAWEARHEVIRPLRTPGGSRRYTASDLERLRLLRAVVEAGHRIGDVAHLDEAALRARLEPTLRAEPGADPFDALWAPLVGLEADSFRRLLEQERAARGALDFARSFALPFLVEVGRRWENGTLSVSAEHLASSILSAMLSSALHASRSAERGPAIVFATPPGERHELGLLAAALTAAEAGADPIYLGGDVPEDELVASALRVGATALVLGLVMPRAEELEGLLRRLRARLPARIELWLGGAGAPRCAPIRGVERLANLDQLAAHVAGKCMAQAAGGA